MSLLAALLIVGGGAFVTGVLVRRRRRAARDASPASSSSELPGFPVATGDVISVGGEEAWLERGWLLEEAGAAVAAVLFGDKRVVLVLPEPRSALYWLSAVKAPALGPEPTSSLDLEGERFERARRIPVSVRAIGKSADPPWDSALLLEYRALGAEVAWMLARGDQVLAWRGRFVEDSELDKWGRES